MNPLLEDFNTAPFSKISSTDYKPAIKKAIEICKQEIETIISNPVAPNFKNTTEALELTGQKLGRITSIFFNLNSAETSEAIQKIEQVHSTIAFRNQQLDFVFDVPSQHVDGLLGDFNLKENPKTFPHKVLVIPGAKTSLLCMNPSFKPFKDPLVRKAIDLLIDRNYIAEELIAGDGIPALKGFAPNSPYYNNQSMADKTFSETQALSL
mgnify:CR=1 FL=1